MKRLALALVGAILIVTTSGADERKLVALPAAEKAALLTEMRSHVENIDDIIKALAEGNFKAAGEIAEIRIDAGHQFWERMKAAGRSIDEIRKMKAAFKAAGGGPGRGPGQVLRGMPGMPPMPPGGGHGPGPGADFARLMPPEFLAMGNAFHDAAQAFAADAAKAASPPTADDYKRAVTGLQGITGVCRACHSAFRVQ